MLAAIGPNLPPLSPKIPSVVKPLLYVLKVSGTYAGPLAAVPTMPAGTPVETLEGTDDASISVMVTPGYGSADIFS